MGRVKLIMEDDRVIPSPIVSIVPTVPAHIAALKRNLRQEDADEILRFGLSVQHALWYSYRRSLIRKTALIDGVVAACWGTSGVFMGNAGTPWLITSPEIKRVSPLRVAREYQKEVAEMLNIFPRLENYVDSSYSAAIRLLEIVGFTIEEPETLRGSNVRKFWIRA